MYGFFKEKFNPQLRREFSPSYCGVCESIYHFSGKKGRFLASFDGAVPLFFLSEIREYQKKDQSCYFRMVNPLEVIGPWEEDSLFLGAITIFYLEINLKDKIQDRESFLGRIIHFWQKDNFSKVRFFLKDKGFPIEKYDFFLKEQQELENSGCKDWDKLAQVSRLSFSLVYQYLWNTPQWVRVGELHGELVYLWDAIWDYHKDLKRKKFNPLLEKGENWIKNKFEELFSDLEKVILKLSNQSEKIKSFLEFNRIEKEKKLKKWKKK